MAAGSWEVGARWPRELTPQIASTKQEQPGVARAQKPQIPASGMPFSQATPPKPMERTPATGTLFSDAETVGRPHSPQL